MSSADQPDFTISPDSIDPAEWRARLTRPEAGAMATFEGWVRSHHEGRTVRSLEYEAYVDLAEKEGRRILAEARERFAIEAAGCVHRVGHLQIGDLAVWAGVSAGHRDAAFAACRYIIDEVKVRVPIWKREHYEDGPSVWINATDGAE